MIKKLIFQYLIIIAQPANDQNIHGSRKIWLLPKFVVLSCELALDFCSSYLGLFILYERCVNISEPAAVTVFPIKIKVVEEVRPEFAAAGSLRNLPPHSPISPFSYLPIFPASLFTPSALLNKINNRSLFKNTQKRYGRGDLAPTLTKIIKTPIVPNAPLVLTVKVGAGSPRPLQSFVTLKITNFALTDNLPGSRPLQKQGEQHGTI